jgi:hypothetical protein
VIKRRFGGAKATTEQLEDIAELARRPTAHIRVVPFAKGAEMVVMGSFQIVDHQDGAVLYTETYNRDAIIHEPLEVEAYRTAFEGLWDISLAEDKDPPVSDFALAWTRSTFCADTSCIELSTMDGDVFLRGSKNVGVPALRFSMAEWDDFRTAVAAGQIRFD